MHSALLSIRLTLTALFSCAVLVGLRAQVEPTEAPRLVITIVVDQLRSDYLEAFMPLYGEGGFKRLMGEGRVYAQAQYPFSRPDRASAVACLYTGCSPYENSVVGERWMNRSLLHPVGSVDDEAYTGINTRDKSSPRQCGVSTITDELKVGSDGKALVFAIAPFRDAAIFSAGHAANAAVWIDDETGQWCTTSYYGSMPSWATSLNNYMPLSERVKTDWEPVNGLVGNFNYFTSRGTRSPFKHKFTGDARYRDFKTSGLINEEVCRMALTCIGSSGAGLDNVTDHIALTLYAGNFRHESATNMPMELQDTYVRLDHALSNFIDEVHKKVRPERVLFVLTSTGYCDEEVPSPEKYRIPTGRFSMVKAASLLNMYLCAVYGQEMWVETHYGRQIFLNHKLIEDKGINQTEMLERCSDFLVQMSGVDDVYTSVRLQLGAWTPGIKALRNSINPKCSGDIIIDVSAGWLIVDEDLGETAYERESYMGFPIIFYGYNIQSATVNEMVEVDCLAPTLARIMRISAPNACKVPPTKL